MLITNLLKTLNAKLAGEMLTILEAVPYLDNAIDEINQNLNSTFPAFSELPSYTIDYNYFPDRYIRSVLIPGAAWYYFTMDEEGISTANQYRMDFDKGLFYMVRDYLEQIPEEYQADTLQGTVKFEFEDVIGTRGMEVTYNPYGFLQPVEDEEEVEEE